MNAGEKLLSKSKNYSTQSETHDELLVGLAKVGDGFKEELQV